jgi:tartrate dehydratase beta subunit/fumarate hydratase class I family protein
LAKKTGVTYPLLADPAGRLRAPLRVRGLPLLVMVDKDGRIAFKQFVEIGSYAQLAQLVKQHLGITP